MSKNIISFVSGFTSAISCSVIYFYWNKNNRELRKNIYNISYEPSIRKQNLQFIAWMISKNMKEIPDSVDFPREVDKICDEIKKLILQQI